jgi:hypothetical protein
VSNEVLIPLAQPMIDWVDDISYAKAVESHANERARPQGGQPHDLEVRIREGILGGRGEASARRWIGKQPRWRILEPLPPPGSPRMPDFGDDIDVKTVYYRRAQLWLTPNCPPDYIYLLVSASLHPVYRIIGWCYGKEMMLQKYWNQDAPREPAWVINQDNPILKAPKMLHEMLLEREMANGEA